ncbi:hypothetical protein HanRHA438_Chr05g0216191 [Helianthus annuus]|nr:hypothetical protein HanRHA438_Chr05g0216191 [Helianthus annuus]
MMTSAYSFRSMIVILFSQTIVALKVSKISSIKSKRKTQHLQHLLKNCVKDESKDDEKEKKKVGGDGRY